MFDDVWQSLGHGVAKLLRHSKGAVFFQFWLGEQLIVDDVVQSVGRLRLVLRPGQRAYLGVVGPRVHGWTFRVRPCGALCVAGAGSQVPSRVGGYGVRGLASPHPILGAIVVLDIISVVPLYMAVTCSVPEEYSTCFFWETPSGLPFSALLGSTVDTCYCQFPSVFFGTVFLYSAMLDPQWYMLCVSIGLALGRILRFSTRWGTLGS